MQADAHVLTPEPQAKRCAACQGKVDTAQQAAPFFFQIVPATDKLLHGDGYAAVLGQHGANRLRGDGAAAQQTRIPGRDFLRHGVSFAARRQRTAPHAGQSRQQRQLYIPCLCLERGFQPILFPCLVIQREHAVRKDIEEGRDASIFARQAVGGDAFRMVQGQGAADAQKTHERRH
ncbi:hypothetical protein D3C81_1604740 [compost metagenome]